jgi:hypothetical protein
MVWQEYICRNCADPRRTVCNLESRAESGKNRTENVLPRTISDRNSL